MARHRILSWLAVIALAAGATTALAACGDDDDDGATSAATTPAETATGEGEATTGGAETTGGAAATATAAAEAQVDAGDQVFAESCASCHGEDGVGGNAPALEGAGTLSNYDNASDLLDYISKNMPASAPGSLSEKQYLDVTAYLLDERDALDDQELTPKNAADTPVGTGD